jgi:mRNA-degrading endonuclease RelE of RelBE toxin-antitoxin system
MRSQENWDLQIDPSVFKILKKIPRHDAEAILKIARLLPLDPYFGDIRKMLGHANAWRRRVGNYRIFYKIKVEGKIILVFHIERRTSKTYR